MPPVKKFVFVKKEIVTSDFVIRDREIGIVENEEKNSWSVYFIRIDKTIDLRKGDFEVFDPIETGDGFAQKVCNVCHRLRDTIEFPRNQNGVNNRVIRRPTCNECRVPMDGVNLSASEKRRWATRKPNLQPFECRICKKRTIPGLTSKVVLDHNHSTGMARGWICDSCNTGIGRFKDDVDLLKRAIIYLEEE